MAKKGIDGPGVGDTGGKKKPKAPKPQANKAKKKKPGTDMPHAKKPNC